MGIPLPHGRNPVHPHALPPAACRELASLYPPLYRLERRGWVKGAWEDSGGRRRRYYRLTPLGKKGLSPLREQWSLFFEALDSLAGEARA